MNKLRIFTRPLFWLFLIIILSTLLRLYKLDSPIADWHSWRQADTAAVARNFYQDEFNPFYPRGDDMSTVSDVGRPNLERLRFVEFPIYNSLVFFAYFLNNGVDERLARLISIVISLGSLIFVYLIAKKYLGTVTGLLAAFLFGVLPFNIYYSRVILPEPLLVFFSLGMVYFVDRWINEDKLWLFITGVLFTALAFLVKPTAVFYLLPLGYSIIKKEQTLFPFKLRYFLWIIPSLLPFIGWRLWISQYPEGIPGSSWLLNGNGIRFRPAFFRWIIGDRFGREILHVTGTVLMVLGLLIKPQLSGKTEYFLHFLALGSFLYLIVFATGNVQHDYYQTLIVPALVIFTAHGFISLFRGIPEFIPRIWTIFIAVFLLVISLVLSWTEVRGLYQVNNWSIVHAGKAADQILPKDAVVLAPYGGDTAFLYQINRPGLPYKVGSIEDLKQIYGITHLVSVAFDDDTQEIMKKYQILEKTENYVIVDLTKPVETTKNDP